MCGIAGIVLRPGVALPDMERRLRAMMLAMAHRGPDDQGYYRSPDGQVGLANVRLAVRDLSPAGHMPMGSADGTTWISYNGECYNPDELRPALERMGHTFRSSSDTELLLAGYQAWGAGVLERARGMFALALYRAGRGNEPGRLMLARDRLGIKPLFYAETPSGLVFASELRALLASGLASRELEPAAVVAYLMLGAVPAPLTIYRAIRSLEPGCTLTLELGSALRPHCEQYWQLPADIQPAEAVGDAVARVRALLEDAVRSHLVSDVPLGAFLSGGLDSSAVVALLRHVGAGTIRTCSMVFEEQAFSEDVYARAMAEAVGAEHHARVLGGSEVLDALPAILQAMDQPTSDGVNSYFVSQTAREAGLTVALSGLGGDELFGGYPNTFAGVPRTLRALQLAGRVPGGGVLAELATGALPVQQRWAKVAAGVGRPATAASAYLVQRGLFAPHEVQALVEPAIWEAAQAFDPVGHIAARADAGAASDPFAWVSRAELRTYTHHQLLRDTDVMSMAHSLEVRVPLLDHRLVEAVLRLPPELKRQNGGGPKPLLAAALGHLLPPLVRERQDKRGFTLPFERWLRGPLQPVLDSWSEGEAGLLRLGALAATRQRFASGRLHWSRLWALAVLQGWSAVGNRQ